MTRLATRVARLVANAPRTPVPINRADIRSYFARAEVAQRELFLDFQAHYGGVELRWHAGRPGTTLGLLQPREHDFHILALHAPDGWWVGCAREPSSLYSWMLHEHGTVTYGGAPQASSAD